LRKGAVVRQVPTWLAEKQRHHWLDRHGYKHSYTGQVPSTKKHQRTVDAAKRKGKKKSTNFHRIKKHAHWKQLKDKLKAAVAAHRLKLREAKKKRKASGVWGRKYRKALLKSHKLKKPKAPVAKARKTSGKKSSAQKTVAKPAEHKETGKKSTKSSKGKKSRKASKKHSKKHSASHKKKLFKVVKGPFSDRKKWLAVPSSAAMKQKDHARPLKLKKRAHDLLWKRYKSLVIPKNKNRKSALRAIRRMIKFRRLRNRKAKLWSTRKSHKLSTDLEQQLTSGKLLARLSSRPGQSGKADGYLLEGAELVFYMKKIEKKKAKGKK